MTTRTRLVTISRNPSAPSAVRHMSDMLLSQWDTAGGKHYVEPESQSFLNNLITMEAKVDTISGSFDYKRYRNLRLAYTKAANSKVEEFTFEGEPMGTQFAYYLLEYLQPHFKKKKP